MEFKNGGRRMSFYNGNWLMEPGIVPTYAADVRDVALEGGKVTVFTGTRPGAARYELGGPMLTLELTAPANNVIGVKAFHFKGRKEHGPSFQLNHEVADVTLDNGAEYLSYKSGELELKISKDCVKTGWSAEFIGAGKGLTRSAFRSLAHFRDVNTGESFMSQQLDIGVGECIYGLGEQFGPLVKNGQWIDMWMADGGTGTEQAYKNVPFYMSNKGYGVFVDSPADVSFEIASVKVERAMFSVEGESLQYYVIYGDTPAEVIERYTFLTGRPALPPAWSMGLWLSTSFTTNYDEKTVTSFIDGMAERNLPLSVFHFDCFWMKGNHWTDFTWDPDMFPNPKEMLANLKERGLHICLWINPYIAQRSRLFDEAVEKGYLLKTTDGSVWQTDLWQSGMGVVDFTNPEACAWYQSHLKTLMEMGVDCFKTDFGERIPVRDIVYYDGSDPVKMHNYYTHLFNKTVFEEIERFRGKGDAVVFARSGTAGTQQFPVHWGGDNAGNYPSMAETLRAGLSLAASGYGFWSHDIGGFEDTAPADIYKRWCAFGLLSSHSRLHGSSSYRVPWNFDDQASDVVRFFTNLKCKLMPYLYARAVDAHKTGVAVLRPMFFEYPDDMLAIWQDKQYMLGENLLVAPIFSPTGEVTFYVPEGKWTDLLNGKIYEGGRAYTEKYDYFSLPLLVRPNTLLPIGGTDSRPDYDYTENLTIQVFELEGKVIISIPNLKGETEVTITAEKSNGVTRITSSKALPNLKIKVGSETYDMVGTEVSL